MASATIGSCFSTTIPPQYFSSKLSSSTEVVLRLAPCSRACRMLSFNQLKDCSFAPVTSSLRRLPRISASVAEEVKETLEEQDEVKETVDVDTNISPRNTKLYFGNLPYNCDSAQLAGIIQQYANPEMVEVLYERETGRSRGFAFVTMSTVEDCEAVINNLDGTQFGGRTMKVNFSDKPKPKLPLYPETEFKLFIGNLTWSVTSEMLTEKFQECGNVIGARVLYDGDTGRSRGYGFVCYSTKEEMDNALETLNGEEIEGRPIRVGLALGRKS